MNHVGHYRQSIWSTCNYLITTCSHDKWHVTINNSSCQSSSTAPCASLINWSIAMPGECSKVITMMGKQLQALMWKQPEMVRQSDNFCARSRDLLRGLEHEAAALKVASLPWERYFLSFVNRKYSSLNISYPYSRHHPVISALAGDKIRVIQ